MTAKQLDLKRADALRNRERILNAAERILERSPSATLADIAAAAGVARSTLHRRFPSVDHELLARYLHTYQQICAGDPAAGPVALEPPSERFHWLTSPRSDVLQTSPIHEGITDQPADALERLYRTYVTD